MTAAGWIFMLTSWGVIVGLFGFTLVRTLTAKTQKPEQTAIGSSDAASGRSRPPAQ